MSQYKVLPPYSEINTINTEYEEDSSFVNFSLSYSSDDTARLVTGGQDGQDQQVRIKSGRILIICLPIPDLASQYFVQTMTESTA